jgi:N-acetyl sugar amidotransferase
MDTSASDIFFDANQICNFCKEYNEISGKIIKEHYLIKQEQLKKLIKQIKNNGEGKPYDCIVGVSGGVDSSWTLVEVKRLGLRPLAVHMDNGWNSELAQNNIASLVNTLSVDLYTHVIRWSEYRELMQAFFDADVIDIELLYDNAMIAVNFHQANKYGLKYILSGSNDATEGMRMPKNWNWLKYDKKNLIAIAKRAGIKKLETFPAINILSFLYYKMIKGINWIPYLNYTHYNKFEALNKLEKNFNFKRYPYKHYESVFTRFYQGYILPKKFRVDKRKLHLSTLIMSEQISRKEALKDLKNIAYDSEKDLKKDLEYFLKKMNWTKSQLENYLCREEVSHSKYSSERVLWDFLKKIEKILKIK